MYRELAHRWPFGHKRTIWEEFDVNTTLTLVGSVGLGMGLMYLLDPNQGNRRRALIRDKAALSVNKTGDAVGTASRDLSNRTRGLVADLASLFKFKSEEVSDDVLEGRVRSKLGRLVSHPGSIEVRADRGRVTLTGPVLAGEVNNLLSCVSSVRGVSGVDNRLQVHEQPDGVPGLQGGSERTGERFELFQENWSPAARVLTGLAGGALLAYGIQRRDEVGAGLGLVGLGLVVRGATNVEVKRWVGLGNGRGAARSAPDGEGNDTARRVSGSAITATPDSPRSAGAR